MNIFTVVKFKKGISVNLKRLQVHKKTGKNHDDTIIQVQDTIISSNLL